MKKKNILAVVLSAVIVISMLSLVACGDKNEIVYDAGEYGQINEGSDNEVIPNAGYRFIGWCEPVKEGNKTIYKAKYEYAEYYLSEVKDVYICPPNTIEGVPDIRFRVTDIQTHEIIKDEFAPAGAIKIKSNTDPRCVINVFYGDGQLGIDKYNQEFDSIVTVTVSENRYNTNTEFKLHLVRNRIVAESIKIEIGGNTIGINTYDKIQATTAPKDTSFKDCGYTVLEIIRNGKPIPQEEISSIVYFDEHPYMHTTNKAQVGDIIKVQAHYVRDPEVKSNILSITVY